VNELDGYHRNILLNAEKARVAEVTEYEVNIRNFRQAIQMIGDDADLQEFKDQLAALLAENILEQKKSRIMLEVVRDQIQKCGGGDE